MTGTPDGRTKAIDWTAYDRVTSAHYARLRRIERMYDSGKIGWEEYMRREREEERRYNQEYAGLGA